MPRSLFSAPNGPNELTEVHLELPFILIGKWTVAFLTGQSWRLLKSWYTVGGPEQGFQRCFAEGLNQSLVLSVVQASINLRKTQGFGILVFIMLMHILTHKLLILILMLMLALCLLRSFECRDKLKSTIINGLAFKLSGNSLNPNLSST